MGIDVEHRTFSRDDRTRFRAKLGRCLDSFSQMVHDGWIEVDAARTGMELELGLVDDTAAPAMRNSEVLQAISDPAFQSELGRFTLEVNAEPRRLANGGLEAFETTLRSLLDRAEGRAAGIGAHLVMIGILPTLERSHLSPGAISRSPRYLALNDQILATRGEDVPIDIQGVERLQMTADSIIPEAACTSTQLHVQVDPDSFPAYWNASQAVAGAQVAAGANSPYLCGRELWCETRIDLFTQAIDLRTEELKAQGVRPRVWFGERWIDSVVDLFEENVRYFPALLPICAEEEPAERLRRGFPPSLAELTLHNGTVYRWNRPVYALAHHKPHLRVENRLLPSGPTVVDTLANAAFYFGLVRSLAESGDPVWAHMSFDVARANFLAGARDGLAAQMYWPRLGRVVAAELIVRELLPAAREGLAAWGVDSVQSDRLLDVIEHRCLTGRTGASWQVGTVHRLTEGAKVRVDRSAALREMLSRYLVHMHANSPVHTWSLD